MHIDDERTLGSYLEEKVIAPVSRQAIRARDLTQDELYSKTLSQLRKEHFGGDLHLGFERLFQAAESGDWYYPLYSNQACEADAMKQGTNLVWFPSEDPAADERPYILLVPGGGFVNVWNLTEGWPVAAQYNRMGYHVFILTYRVGEGDGMVLLQMQDMARALEVIRENAAHFHVKWDRYITCGFSAGGYIVCLWNTETHGFSTFGMPSPRAVFPVYPLVSWRLCMQDEDYVDFTASALGKNADIASFEVPQHVAQFPPCALFLAAGDTLVAPAHSRLLAEKLRERGIPCNLEIGPEGGHGFADGEGMCMAGWVERAVKWWESLSR